MTSLSSIEKQLRTKLEQLISLPLQNVIDKLQQMHLAQQLKFQSKTKYKKASDSLSLDQQSDQSSRLSPSSPQEPDKRTLIFISKILEIHDQLFEICDVILMDQAIIQEIKQTQNSQEIDYFKLTESQLKNLILELNMVLLTKRIGEEQAQLSFGIFSAFRIDYNNLGKSISTDLSTQEHCLSIVQFFDYFNYFLDQFYAYYSLNTSQEHYKSDQRYSQQAQINFEQSPNINIPQNPFRCKDFKLGAFEANSPEKQKQQNQFDSQFLDNKRKSIHIFDGQKFSFSNDDQDEQMNFNQADLIQEDEEVEVKDDDNDNDQQQYLQDQPDEHNDDLADYEQLTDQNIMNDDRFTIFTVKEESNENEDEENIQFSKVTNQNKGSCRSTPSKNKKKVNLENSNLKTFVNKSQDFNLDQESDAQSDEDNQKKAISEGSPRRQSQNQHDIVLMDTGSRDNQQYILQLKGNHKCKSKEEDNNIMPLTQNLGGLSRTKHLNLERYLKPDHKVDTKLKNIEVDLSFQKQNDKHDTIQENDKQGEFKNQALKIIPRVFTKSKNESQRANLIRTPPSIRSQQSQSDQRNTVNLKLTNPYSKTRINNNNSNYQENFNNEHSMMTHSPQFTQRTDNDRDVSQNSSLDRSSHQKHLKEQIALNNLNLKKKILTIKLGPAVFKRKSRNLQSPLHLNPEKTNPDQLRGHKIKLSPDFKSQQYQMFKYRQSLRENHDRNLTYESNQLSKSTQKQKNSKKDLSQCVFKATLSPQKNWPMISPPRSPCSNFQTPFKQQGVSQFQVNKNQPNQQKQKEVVQQNEGEAAPKLSKTTGLNIKYQKFYVNVLQRHQKSKEKLLLKGKDKQAKKQNQFQVKEKADYNYKGLKQQQQVYQSNRVVLSQQHIQDNQRKKSGSRGDSAKSKAKTTVPQLKLDLIHKNNSSIHQQYGPNQMFIDSKDSITSSATISQNGYFYNKNFQGKLDNYSNKQLIKLKDQTMLQGSHSRTFDKHSNQSQSQRNNTWHSNNSKQYIASAGRFRGRLYSANPQDQKRKGSLESSVLLSNSLLLMLKGDQFKKQN